MNAGVEQLEFQAEARQLLDLMVHSVYSNKDSFLRELISNASDALDKLRLEAFRNKDLDVDTSDLHIEIEVDKDARTLTIRDNGIGMTRDEVVGLIGTLAKSGTAELRQQLREETKNEAASEELIGQFGIGFYSSFMVADKVELLTRKAGESEATRWESSGEGTYTIESVDDAPQGTSVTLHLKPEDAEDELHDYTSEWKIKSLVKKYSDFIAWPIRMEVERRTPAPSGGRWRRGRHHRDRDPQLDEGAVGQAQRRGLRRGVQGVLQAHRARLGRPAGGHRDEGRGHLRVPGPAVHPVARTVRPVQPRRQHRGPAVRQARVHHGRLRPAHARIPALRQGRRRRTGHVAQRFPRNPAAGSADQGDPSPSDQEGPVHDQGSAVRAARRTTAPSGPSSAGSSKRACCRTSTTRTRCCAFPRSPRRTARRTPPPSPSTSSA